MFKKLIIAATLLALGVIVLGAYVRLSDAGLGCPDWPGCYGKLSPAHAAEPIAQAETAQPGGPVSAHKAWKEMVHRYFASTLGLLIVVIGVMAWVKREQLMQGIGLPLVLIVLVILQGLLGMWTVTLLLKPVIVTLHLLGGVSTLALLVWLGQRQSRDIPEMRIQDAARMKSWALAGLVVVFLQIALGGWVSSNYAALACADFPTCKGAWVPAMDFNHAFHFTRELGKTAQGELLSLDSLTAIHWMHRVGALITFLFLAVLVFKMLRIPSLAKLGAVIGLVLLLQIGLGISNVLFSLPLSVAVAHNGVAALLLVSLIILNFRLTKALKRS
ncbi:MAG: COX15/CtaA family protein [Burkholderiales bacterium]|nr:COX15/CtaA family protein [Burkholderiales bacterium]